MSDDWGFPDPTADALTTSPGPEALARSRDDLIARVEDEVHREAATVMQDALAFAEIDPETYAPPEHWVKELGEERAQVRFRTAKYALLTAKEAPIGLKLAKDAMVGMAKAKAHKKTGSHALNVLVIKMTGPVPTYEIVEVSK